MTFEQAVALLEKMDTLNGAMTQLREDTAAYLMTILCAIVALLVVNIINTWGNSI